MSARRPYIIGVPSDVHFGIVHSPTLEAFEHWVREVRPDELLFNGDTFDFAQLSDYPKGEDTLPYAVEEVKFGVRVINRLHRYVPRIRIMWGNHCKRWERTVIGQSAQSLKGARGLTLKDQCAFQGLDPRVEWVKETARTPGVRITEEVRARHGDLQSGRFGGSVNLSTNRLSKNQGISELIGHNHRAQLAYRTAWDRTSFVMALPTMANYENYAPAADWQRGWGVLTLHRPRSPKRGSPTVLVQPSLVLVQDGIAMWGGRVYGRHQK